MAKDIIIQDEYYRANHMSGVTRLRTELEDGGVCYWIPEDEAVALTEKTITENGTYNAVVDDASGYSTVVVNVPNVFGEHDEGRVVKSGALVDQSSRTISANGTYDTTLNDSVTVETTFNLSAKTITVNGTYQASTDNVDGYSDVTVSVPNTYSSSDEGKVVYLQHYLVTQSSLLITKDGEYNTTYNDRVVVETGSYGPPNLIDYTVSENGTYSASEYGYDGFSEVTVDVQPSVTYQTFSENGTYSASEYGYDGFSEVTVDVQPSVTYQTFSENGTYSASEYGYDGFSEIEISVSSPVRFIIDRTIEYFEDNELEAVGRYAFAGCTSLQTVSLPKCAYIYSSAFYGCDSLEYMYLLNPTSMTMLYEDPFSNSSIPTIYVPGGLAMDYKDDSYWGLYSDYIVAYEEENET